MKLINLNDGESAAVHAWDLTRENLGKYVQSDWASLPFFTSGPINTIVTVTCDRDVGCLLAPLVLIVGEGRRFEFAPCRIDSRPSDTFPGRKVDFYCREIVVVTPPSPPKKEVTSGVGLIAAERKRQIESEGYSPKGDTGYQDSELLQAADCYVSVAVNLTRGHDLDSTYKDIVRFWPWNIRTFKPTADRVRNLVKAGALIAAVIDRIQAEP